MEINIIETVLYLSDMCYSLNEDSLRNENLTRPESFLLLSIRPGEKISSNELAARNRLSPSRISRIADQLIAKGLLVREVSGDDRRSVRLSLSEEGTGKYKELIKLKNQCEKKIKSHLGEDELSAVEDGLTYLTQAMER